MNSPDKICENAANQKISVKIEKKEDFILIEGDAEGLQFLSDLIGAQAQSNDTGFHIAPNAAGSLLFSKGSNTGIYIHRIDSQ